MIINLPHRAILQQQTHLMSTHQLWKKHVPLECSVQPQQAKQLTTEANTPLRCSCLSWGSGLVLIKCTYCISRVIVCRLGFNACSSRVKCCLSHQPCVSIIYKTKSDGLQICATCLGIGSFNIYRAYQVRGVLM